MKTLVLTVFVAAGLLAGETQDRKKPASGPVPPPLNQPGNVHPGPIPPITPQPIPAGAKAEGERSQSADEPTAKKAPKKKEEAKPKTEAKPKKN